MRSYEDWKYDKMLEEGLAEKLGILSGKTVEWINQQKQDFSNGYNKEITEKQAVNNLKDTLNVVQRMQKTIIQEHPTLDDMQSKTRQVAVSLYKVEDGLNKIIDTLEKK